MKKTKKQPLIGITSGKILDHNRPWAPSVMGQARTYVEAVIDAGGVPVILPMTSDVEVIKRLADTCDGFLFSGGNDIHPQRYNEENRLSIEIDELRDEFEFELFDRVDKLNKPMLAICRGMQVINVGRGGSLYQDIPADYSLQLNHRISTELANASYIAHRLEVDPSSVLGQVVEVSHLLANSRHHQAVKQLGSNLRATIHAEDGVVEAIEDPSRDFLIGIQCHPESLYVDIDDGWSKLFMRFVAACNK